MYKFLKLAKIAIFTSISFNSLSASQECFIAKENGKIIKQTGKCDVRRSPFSTFKIPLAVMGFDADILNCSHTPQVKFTEENKKFVTYYNPEKYPSMLLWKRPHTPKSWMRDSVVWFSRYISHKLGIKRFHEYIKKFNYGNKDIDSSVNKNDALMNSWLEGSLDISPLEQLEFIEKLAYKKLPASKSAQEKTIEIIKLEPIFEDWQMYGKTGGSKSLGWFVGWIEKDSRKIMIVQYIEQPESSPISGGRMAKEIAKDNLIDLLL
jgi:beta-lactamase class D